MFFFEKMTSFLEDQRKECWICFYSISKQGTKVLFFVGGGVGGGDKDRVLKGIKQIGINREHRKTSGEEGGQANLFQGN